MTLLILSFAAGVLTVAAPCILPLLPVIVGGSIASQQKSNQWYRPLVIATSLAAAVVIFTLLLKATSALLGVPQATWNVLSGLIVLLFGFNMLFPRAWEQLMVQTGIYKRSNALLGASYKQKGLKKDILLGAALGPVFSSCSPTYALIVATVLPQSLGVGLGYLVAYALGLAAALLIIASVGRAAVQKLGWLHSRTFLTVTGILFIAVGIAVLFGWDKALQAYVLEQGWYDPIMRLEQRFMH